MTTRHVRAEEESSSTLLPADTQRVQKNLFIIFAGIQHPHYTTEEDSTVTAGVNAQP